MVASFTIVVDSHIIQFLSDEGLHNPFVYKKMALVCISYVMHTQNFFTYRLLSTEHLGDLGRPNCFTGPSSRRMIKLVPTWLWRHKCLGLNDRRTGFSVSC